MNEALAAWMEKLQQQQLPALKVNRDVLQQISVSKSSDMGQLALVIESDPGLSLLLLRHINQLRRKHNGNEITTPRHALMMLGMEQFRSLLDNAPIAEDLPQESQQRLRQQFSQGFHAGCQARALGRLNRDIDLDELFTAAQLHNLGEMLLNLHAPDEVDRVYEQMEQGEEAAEEAQLAIFGFSFDQLTLEVARAWHLPSLICDSVQPENASNDRVLTINVSAQVARCSRRGWYNMAIAELVDGMAEYMLRDSGSIATLFHQSAVEAAHGSLHYGVPHPASLLLLPAQAPDEEGKITEVAEAVSKEMKAAPAPASVSEEGDFCNAPQWRVLAQVMKSLKQPDTELAPKEVLRLAMEGMRDGLGLTRVVFAGLTPDKGQLRANYMLGSDNDPAFKRFAIELRNHNLFVRLMEKQQSLWLDDNNRKKYFPLIPINFQKLIDNDSFFVMSLHVHNKPVGLFYADRRDRNCRLDEMSYKRFKQLVMLAGQQMEKK